MPNVAFLQKKGGKVVGDECVRESFELVGYEAIVVHERIFVPVTTGRSRTWTHGLMNAIGLRESKSDFISLDFTSLNNALNLSLMGSITILCQRPKPAFRLDEINQRAKNEQVPQHEALGYFGIWRHSGAI